MATFLEAVALGVVQGLTEFLPISSSGHLVLARSLLGWTDMDANMAFSIAVHFGSLLAVLVFVRRELVEMVTTRRRLTAVVALATVPLVAAVLATPAREWVKQLSTVPAVGGFLLCMALILMLVRKMSGKEEEGDLSYRGALLIGCAQVLAILPGISRSGITLAAGIRSGLRASQALRFAFLLAVPAIGGAFVLEIYEGGLPGKLDLGPMFGGGIASFLTSLWAMQVMAKIVKERNLVWFAIYCAVVGAAALIASAV